MATLDIRVTASTDDTNSASNSAATGGTGSVVAGDLTATLLSPGYHNTNDHWYVGARFLNVTIPNAATISSATFRLTAQGTYNAGSGTIRFTVSCHAADNGTTFSTSTGANLSTTARPRTTAKSTWTQTSVVAETEYSVDITAAVQEVVNRAGWTSGNALVVIVEDHANTTLGEWQDYYSYNNTPAKAPRIVIDYTTSGATFTAAAAPALSAVTGAVVASHTPPAFSAATAGVVSAVTGRVVASSTPSTATAAAAATLTTIQGSAVASHTPPTFSAVTAGVVSALTGTVHASFTPPTFSAEMGGVLGAVQGGVVASHIPPTFSAVAAGNLGAVHGAAVATFTAAGAFTATIHGVLSAATGTGSVAHTPPTFDAVGISTLNAIRGTAHASHTPPVVDAVAAGTLGRVQGAALARFTEAGNNTAEVRATLSALIGTAHASHTPPTYDAAATGTVSAVTGAIVASHAPPTVLVVIAGTLSAAQGAAIATTTAPPSADYTAIVHGVLSALSGRGTATWTRRKRGHVHLIARRWIFQQLDSLSGVVPTSRIPPGPWPPNIIYLYVVEQAPGNDQTALGGKRVQTQPLYLVCVIAAGESLAALEDTATTLDMLLHDQAGEVTTGGRVLSCTREQPFSRTEIDKHDVYTYLGGLYRLQVQEA